jgi:hypothetical protein
VILIDLLVHERFIRQVSGVRLRVLSHWLKRLELPTPRALPPLSPLPPLPHLPPHPLVGIPIAGGRLMFDAKEFLIVFGCCRTFFDIFLEGGG